jgi:nicotinamidase-related amidase
MIETLPQDAVLLIVDVQEGFDDPKWGHRNNPQAEQNIARLLNAWRETRWPVVHVQHLSSEPDSPLRPNSPGNQIKKLVEPGAGEPIIQKRVNSAFIGTDLEQLLRAHQYRTLVITGLTTPHCVSTTTRMAGNLGFDTFVVPDATAAFDITGYTGELHPAEQVHAWSLSTLHQEFATVVNTEDIIGSL